MGMRVEAREGTGMMEGYTGAFAGEGTIYVNFGKARRMRRKKWEKESL